jgi:hypothetical protein
MTLSRSEALSIASRAHARDARHRLHKKAMELGLVRKATVSLAAGAMGAMKKHGVANDIKGFPWKLGLWTLATGFELMGTGMLQAAAAGVSDSAMAIYVHDAVASGSLVAGDGGEI